MLLDRLIHTKFNPPCMYVCCILTTYRERKGITKMTSHESITNMIETTDQPTLFGKISSPKITENDTVPFSRAIVLGKTSLSLYAQRILRIIASQIQPGDSKDTLYTFDIKDFANFFGITSKVHSKIKAALIELRSTTIVLPIGKGRITGYINVGQINEGTVEIDIDPILKPLYQISYSGKYPIKYIKGFSYTNTYRFYELFLYRLRGEDGKILKEVNFYMSLDDLREWLNLEKGSYKNFADIRKRIIVPAISDINGQKFSETSKIEENDYCNLTVNYEEVKQGRKIIGIDFRVKQKSSLDDNTDIDLVALGEPISFQLLTENQKLAYQAFVDLKIHKRTINDAYNKYGAEGLYKIYLYYQQQLKKGSIKQSKTGYAATCLQNGYMLTEPELKIEKQELPFELPTISEDEQKYEEDPLVQQKIEAYIQNLNKEEKENLIDELKAGKKDFVAQMITGKNFDEIYSSYFGKKVIYNHIKKIM